MKESQIYGITIMIAVVGLVVVHHYRNKKNQTENFKENSLISPKNFSVGLEDKPMTKSSNMCNDKVMYSLDDVTVDYGLPPLENCACTEFIQAP